MSKERIVKNEIVINGPAHKVWDALVNPEQTKKYMFGCETVSDWKPGSTLLWRGLHEGKEMIFVKGNILEIRPEEFLEYTTIDPNSNIDDTSENYLHVTYSLLEQQGKTKLTVTQGDYFKVAEGDRRYAEAYNGGQGWSPILTAIKELVEH
ncbi:MAG: SRPBCC domain-containing protein [Chryseolinea sp.]